MDYTGVPIADNRMIPAVSTSRVQLDAAVESQTGRPLRPGNVQIVGLSGTAVSVQWRDNSISEAVFFVSVAPVNNSLLPPRSATAAQNATTVNVTGLTPNQRYNVTVQACGAANPASLCSPVTPLVAITTLNTLPTVPTSLRAGTITTSSIEVRWDSNSANPVTQFRLRSNANPSRTWTSQVLAAAARSHSFANLAPNSGYSFVIQACNNDGCSADSSLVTLLTQSAGSPPAAPSGLHLCGTQFLELCFANRTTLLWTDNASNEDRYEFEWTAAPVGLPPWQWSWSVAVLPVNRTSYFFTSLSSGMLYYFRVRACNVAGCSAYSNTVSYTPP